MRRMIHLKDGSMVLACSCGKPYVKGVQAYVIRIEQGDLAGEEMLCHKECVKAVPIHEPK